MVKLKSQVKQIDRQLLLGVFVLVIIGLVAVADASGPLAFRDFGDRYFFLKSQLPIAIAGFVIMFVVSRISYRFWEKFAVFFFISNIFLMVLVFVPGIGARYLGASRWIDLGFTHLQPSEFLKLTIAIYLAKVASKGKPMASFIIPLCLSVILIMLQPDLGTTLVVVCISMIQLFVSGVNLLPFVATGVVGTVFAYLLIVTSEYRKRRLDAFLDAMESPVDASYHVRQILIALGSGGLFGVGLGQSKQKFLFLPETATDSIFPVIAEEIGFVGSIVLLSFLALFVYRGYVISKQAPDRFSQILAIGLTGWIASQSFLNLGSMVALIPITGVPLPFISYGGTSLLCLMVATGILLSISRESVSKTSVVYKLEKVFKSHIG